MHYYKSGQITTAGPGAVGKLVQRIIERASAMGMSVYRYQTNSRRHGYPEIITWALHPSDQPRPQYSRQCEGPKCTLSTIEGITERCEAYRKLQDFIPLA